MNKDDFGSFSGSLQFNRIEFNPDAIPAPNTLHIRMTRGERHIADELRKAFGGFERVIIDVDGERHEFDADSLIRMLESYEGASRYAELFGTPERAARTMIAVHGECETSKSCYPDCPFGAAPTCPRDCWPDDYDALLGWLRGDA